MSLPTRMPEVPVHGNFRRYYGMRSAGAAARACSAEEEVYLPRDGVDERVRCLLSWLSLHGAEVRRIERVLDIGCNAAKPLLELCQLLPNSLMYVLGVDIDAELVAQARAALRQAWCERQPRTRETTVAAMQYFPACFSSLLDPLPFAPVGTDTLPAHVHFVQGDWPRMDPDPEGFDLVLCLAVSKWIHLNQGDDGLFLCLSRMASQLRPGGLVALEIQPWRSYEQARSLSKELRASHARLRIQPDDIGWILECLGLVSLGSIGHGTGHGTQTLFTPGFQRALTLFQRPLEAAHVEVSSKFTWPWVARPRQRAGRPKKIRSIN